MVIGLEKVLTKEERRRLAIILWELDMGRAPQEIDRWIDRIVALFGELLTSEAVLQHFETVAYPDASWMAYDDDIVVVDVAELDKRVPDALASLPEFIFGEIITDEVGDGRD